MSDDHDDPDWKQATRGIRKLPAVRPADGTRPPPKRRAIARDRGDFLPPPAPPARQSADLDRRTEEKLRSGDLAIEGRLDLHGLTRDQALDALLRFIPAAYGAGKRCVLVITGKGTAPGVLRSAVPDWLRDARLSGFILRAHPAQPRHGGEGALYVLLRRRRD